MYIELHCHSAFSFLDGTAPPEALVLQAQVLGYPALALTDHNGLYGSMAFAQAARHLGLQPITGAEVTLLDGTHVTLLAETPRGYANLCRLITEAHLGREDRRDPRLDFESLVARQDGLIVLSGCRNGLLPAVLARDGPTAARRFAARCHDRFGRATGCAAIGNAPGRCVTSPRRSGFRSWPRATCTTTSATGTACTTCSPLSGIA
jgi:error-prone DNA polymerase